MADTTPNPPDAPVDPPVRRLSAEEQDHEDRRQGTRGAATNFLTLAGQAALLIFQVLGARMFGAAVWGAYAFGVSLLEIGARLGLVGTDKGILIFVAARRSTGDLAGADRALATGIRLAVALGCVIATGFALAAGAVGRSYHNPNFGLALLILAPAVPMVTLTTVLLAATMARKNLRYNLLVKGVTEPVLRVGLVVVAGLAASGITGLSFVHLLAATGTLSVAVWSFSRLFPLRKMAWAALRLPFDGGMVSYAVPLAVSELVNGFLAQTSILLLGKYRPAEEVGIYGASLVLAAAVSFVRGAFDTVLAPIAAEAWVNHDHPRLASNLRSQSCMVLLFAIPLSSLFIVGGKVLLGLHGAAFVAGTTTLLLLATGHVVNASCGLAGWVLMAGGRSRTMLVNNLLALAANVGLCLVLIPRFGMEGAALAALCALVVLQAVQSFEAHLLARAHPFSRAFLRLAALGVVIMVAEWLLVNHLPGPPIAIAAGVIFVGALAFWGLAWAVSTPEHRDMLRGLLLRRFRGGTAAT